MLFITHSISKFPTFQLPSYPTFQLPGYLVLTNLSDCLAVWLSGSLAGHIFWLAGSNCYAISISTCFNSIHVLLTLFSPVAPTLSTCCSPFFHLLIPLNPLFASVGPTQYFLNYINMHIIRQYLYDLVLG